MATVIEASVNWLRLLEPFASSSSSSIALKLTFTDNELGAELKSNSGGTFSLTKESPRRNSPSGGM